MDTPESPRAPRSRTGPVIALVGVLIASVLTVVAVTSGQRTGGPGLQVPDSEPSPLVDTQLIISGGQPRDGIPALDSPRFESVAEVDWLNGREPVVALVVDGSATAYPLQILIWHEIVNDEAGGTPVVVSFCPLCYTAYAYVRPLVEGELTTFGVSGDLLHSNLVMFDRTTGSYWPQAMGQAVTGPLTGSELERLATQIVSWEDFSEAWPDGRVLSRDTGFDREYGRNPYPGYDDVGTPPYAFFTEDYRLDATARILGVEAQGAVTAFPYRRLSKKASDGIAAVNATVGAESVVVVWRAGTLSALDAATISSSKDTGAASAFSRTLDGDILEFEVRNGRLVDLGTGSVWNAVGRAVDGPLAGAMLTPADAHDSYWFDWAAFHPQTHIFGGKS